MADNDLSNLNPRSDREWLMKLNWRFDMLEESIAEDRETYLNIFKELKTANEKQDGKIDGLEKCSTTSTEKIDQLEKRVNGWNVLNSLGVIIAGILAALGLRGS